ncbi:hypothetical protein LAD77_00130 [Klebsiella pneumoniae]|nr:hypothetical protein [Klebsiella pneumoniae]
MIEVEKLNGGANERATTTLCVIDRGGSLRVFESGGCGLHRSYLIFAAERKPYSHSHRAHFNLYQREDGPKKRQKADNFTPVKISMIMASQN